MQNPSNENTPCIDGDQNFPFADVGHFLYNKRFY